MGDTLKPPSRILQRLIDTAAAIEADDPKTIVFQHSIFCQVCLPYRDPGDGVTVWDRRQGRAALLVEARPVLHPQTEEWVRLGLPFGPTPRLILTHLNSEAIRTQCPVIEAGNSLTAFARELLGDDPRGHQLRAFKEQFARLAAAEVRLAFRHSDEHVDHHQAHIISDFDLWFSKDARRRVVWTSTIQLSLGYFADLVRHAVPLDPRAIAALSKSAMGLDVYAWLAQRLHRITPGKPQFVTWKAIKDQFGWNYERVRDFRRVFRATLIAVASQYRAARFELDDRGLTLRYSPPPIKGRYLLVPGGLPPKDEAYHPIPGD